MNEIDKKVASVRKVEEASEIKKYEGTKGIVRRYMSSLNEKADKTLLKVANVYIPFSIGGLTVAAGGSFLGVADNELTLSEAVKYVGTVGASEAAIALGIVLATVSAISAKEALSFTNSYLSYPKNKEELQRLGIYHKVEDAMNNFKQNLTIGNDSKEVTK